MEEPYIAALDVGTTTIRCHIVNTRCQSVGIAQDKIELLYPEPGFVEIDPEKLWISTKEIISKALKAASISPGQISCLGLTTQRATFITWDKLTGKPFHNFITWKDLRANSLVKEWDKCLTMKAVRAVSYLLYLITQSKRYLAGSVIHYTNAQVTLRLLWVLKNIPSMKAQLNNNNVMFGTIESWLIYKLTNHSKHVTDITNASATGLYDPFILNWSPVLSKVFGIPLSIFPSVIDNITNFHVDQTIFGVEIPIVCSVADQSASIFGSCCFNKGDIKMTLGTGGFLDITTGLNPHASVNGVYPLVGWKIGQELVYVAEGATNDVGSLIEWALNIGLINTADESSVIASSLGDNNGLYFIPAFSGLGAPVNDCDAATGFIGIKPNTTKACMIRAILESIAFRLYQLYEVVLKETGMGMLKIKVDGGVSKNNFICQLLADMTNLPVERATTSEMTIQGVVYLCGMHLGVWKSKDDLVDLRRVDHTFKPHHANAEKYLEIYGGWLKAINKFKKWY